MLKYFIFVPSIAFESLAARPEWSSFCRSEAETKKRERRADKAAQIKNIYK